MSATGSRLSTLPDVGALLEVLFDDERPSLIVELSASGTLPAQVVFRNAALASLVAKSEAETSVAKWVDSSAVQILQGVDGSIPFCGRYWSSKRFRGTWRIVSCGADVQTGPRTPESMTTEQRTEITLTEEPVDMFPGLLSPFQAVELSSQPRRPSRNLADWTISEPGSPWLRFIKDHPWDQTRFDAMKTWSSELRRLAINIMNRSEPRLLLWGSEQLVMYNEAFANMIGRSHPSSLGLRYSDVKSSDSIYNSLSDMLRDSFGQGKSTKFSNTEALVERNGFLEQTYWGTTLLPQSGNHGSLDSAIVEFNEVTETVLQDQRRAQSEDIFNSVSKAETLPQLCSNFLGTLENNALEISYAMIYTALDQSRTTQTNGLPTPADDLVTTPSTEPESFSFSNQFQLADSIGLSENAFSQVVNIAAPETTSGRSLAHVFRETQSTQEVVVLHNADLPQELCLETPQTGSIRSACVFPVLDLNGRSLAFVILGMNPRRPYTDHSNRFVFYIRETICKYAILLTLPEEQRIFQKKFEDATMGLSHQLRLSILKAKKKEERFRRIARSAPLGMYLYLPKDKAFHVNEAYLRMTGVTKESMEEDLQSGFPWLKTISEEYVDVAVNEWRKIMTKKTPSAIEYKLRCPPGGESQPKYVSATSFPDLDEHGDVVLIHGWLIDISDRKCKESLLAQRLEVALDNKKATEHFLDMVSHEMRNPLSAIFQSTDAILEATKQYASIPDIQPACLENLQIVEDAAQTIALCAHHQKSIFDDILTVSKLDSSLLDILPEEVRPTEVVEKALKMYDQEARRSDIKTSVEIEDSYRQHISDTVMVDPNRLLQIIINLLQNAIKFTQSSEERQITVFLGASDREPTNEDQPIDLMPLSAKKTSSPLGTDCEHKNRFSAAFRSPDSADHIYLYCTVEDTGCGLSENEKRLMFKRFSQPMTYKQYGGSGLGLYLSKELVELQGGRIGLRSQEDVGTSFGFYIRCKRVDGTPGSTPSQSALHAFAPPDSPMSPHPRGHRPKISRTEAFQSEKIAEPHQRLSDGNLHVLVVEDNLINQKVMAKQLRNLGCTVHVANHGIDALRFVAGSSVSLASTSENNIPLDIILMDIEMPLMNGLEAVRRIREMQGMGLLTRHVPTIAVTANARSEQQSAAMEAGMDDVVTKPFRIPDLLGQMRALVSRRSSL